MTNPYILTSSNLDSVLARIQGLTMSTPSVLPSSSVPMIHQDCTLDPPFSLSLHNPIKRTEVNLPTTMDPFARNPMTLQLSPTSSESSVDSVASSTSRQRLSSLQAFRATRSCVLRLYNLPNDPDHLLSAVFLTPDLQSISNYSRGSVPVPSTMWALREPSSSESNSLWAVYRSHEEACAALLLCGRVVSVTTALESDLEPFHKLRRYVVTPPTPIDPRYSPLFPQSTHSTYMQVHTDNRENRPTLETNHFIGRSDYTLSSNPPSPRTSFRLGDWICSSPKCAAHNFGRNLSCIGCGCPRASGPGPSQTLATNLASRATPSPRFASFGGCPPPGNTFPNYPPQPQQQQHIRTGPPHHIGHPMSPPLPPAMPSSKSVHPLLTPSGRAIAVGGKVQNVSSDPMSPCIMYWPDNEPFPEQGQIRPSGLVGVPQPPILNTGNRGPISHQPGDWICLKCNYLNWRRRKVCQTCLPYAEGNGDSISAAVQAERIALLTSVLSQPHGQLPLYTSPEPMGPALQNTRSQSLTPPHMRHPYGGGSHAMQDLSQVSQFHDSKAQIAQLRPIYQTSGHRQESPLYSTGPNNCISLSKPPPPVHAPAPLLPSFLQDIVQPPALSPASTSSADLSEEYDIFPLYKTGGQKHETRTKNSVSPIGNIWRFDGDECKSLAGFALPNHEELVGNNNSKMLDKSRIQVVSS